MPTSTMLRNRYVSDSVETMSPGRLIVALYDRALLDLDRARTAIAGNDIGAAHDALVHAQDIVFELLHNLDTTRWPAGQQLASVYQFVLEELVAANVRKDIAHVDTCAQLLEPLRDAWRQAAGIAGSPAA
jgi:flagellar secretion chaperone FliS